MRLALQLFINKVQKPGGFWATVISNIDDGTRQYR